MKTLKRLIALATMMVMVGSSFQTLSAQEYVSEVAGSGYDESRRSPSLTPALALGAIALVAIIAVALQNSGHGHSHGHSHD